ETESVGTSRRSLNKRLPLSCETHANLPSEQRQPPSPFRQVHSHVSRHFGSPDTRNKSFRLRHVRRVFVTKFLEHHPLLIADPKRDENPKRDEVRLSTNPMRKDKPLAK